MSWFDDNPEPSMFERFCYCTVKAGHVPQHLAIIMDGNRRYAKREGKSTGHPEGFEKLTQVLSWCFHLGIPELTVYAFSTENFKRSKEEVDSLMQLAKDKFYRLLEERELIEKHGVCVRVLGDLSMFPADVQLPIAKVVNLTRNNTRHILNVAIAYTSREEITNAVREICKGVQNGLIETSDITPKLIEKCLYTNKCRDVDLLIRTSGEVRLSDFLLWQTSFSMLSFIEPLWPELTLMDFLYVIIKYQLGFDKLQNQKNLSRLEHERYQLEEEFQMAHKNLISKLSKEGKGNGSCNVDKEELETELRRSNDERKERIKNFLDTVNRTRFSYIEKILQEESC